MTLVWNLWYTVSMIRNEIENTIAKIEELKQDIAYLECWLNHPDSLSEYEQAFQELLNAKTELAVLQDTSGVA